MLKLKNMDELEQLRCTVDKLKTVTRKIKKRTNKILGSSIEYSIDDLIEAMKRTKRGK